MTDGSRWACIGFVVIRMGNRHFKPLYERYGAVRSARNRQRHHELSQGRYPRCERDKADFDGFAAVIRKYMGIPELTPAIVGAFGKKTIVLPIRWTAAVGGRSGLPKAPSGNENITRTRGFPRGREKAGQHGKGHAALQDTSPYGYAGFAPPSPNLSGVASGPYFSAGENKERERVEENCRPQ